MVGAGQRRTRNPTSGGARGSNGARGR